MGGRNGMSWRALEYACAGRRMRVPGRAGEADVEVNMASSQSRTRCLYGKVARPDGRRERCAGMAGRRGPTVTNGVAFRDGIADSRGN